MLITKIISLLILLQRLRLRQERQVSLRAPIRVVTFVAALITRDVFELFGHRAEVRVPAGWLAVERRRVV